MAIKPTSVPTKRLQASISATALSFQLSDILGWDGDALGVADFGATAYAVLRNANNTQIEILEFDPATIASSSITINKRGLDYTGDLTTEVTARKFAWTKGTFVELGTHVPQLYQWLKEYIDAAAIAGGVPATTTVLGLSKVSVAPASAASPIAVGDNDPRVPTSTGAAFLNAVTGIISMYGGSSAPTGFLLCDGSAVSRTTYAALFAVISTSYGVGDGSTTFNVPDLRGRVPVGKGTGTKVATFASRSSDTITVTGPTNVANNEFQTGQAVTYHTATSVITGLTNDTVYYLIRVTNLSFKLASSLANAQNGTAISLSSDGSGAQTFTLALTARTVGDTGGEENHAMSATELLSHIHTPTANSGGAAGNSMQTVSTGTVSGGFALTMMQIQPTGGNAAMNDMQPFAVVNYIIKI